MFIDRSRELGLLEERYGSGRAELILVYGRRRVGKTFLMRRFLQGKRGAYLVVTRTGPGVLRDFSRALAEQLGLDFAPALESYRDLYELLGRLSSEERLVLVIDEFQRLAERDESFLMELQAAWDEFLSSSRLMLILVGSAVGAVERVGLSPSSPLYGRRTAQLRLRPFGFSCAKEFFPGYSDEDKVRAYSVFGGTPAYLSLVDPSRDLMENVASLVLDRGGPLYEEPQFILSQETREPLRYMAILEAMSSGATKLGEIASAAGMRPGDLPRYMRTLIEELDLVERRYPLGEEGKRGRARYHLSDEFLRFWFRFVRPHLHVLELGEVDRVLRVVESGLDEHASLAFEEVAMEHFTRVASGAALVGRWWRGGVEIDGVALDDREGVAYFMEAKWSRRPVGRDVLRGLIRKASHFGWRRGRREEVYVIYSRSGFTFEGGDNVVLVPLEELVRDLDCPPP